MRRKLLLILLIPLLFTACPKTHPADTVGKVLVPATDSYIYIQQSLIEARKAGVINDATWEIIDQKSDEGDVIFKNALHAWQALSEVNTPENVGQVVGQLRKLLELARLLMGYLPSQYQAQANGLLDRDYQKVREMERQ